MRRSPYERTLFLDTDTFVGAPLDDCWELLDHFDIAAAGDRGYVDSFPEDTGVPATYKEINAGVVFFRRSAAMQDMFDQALAHYDRMSAGWPPTKRVTFYDQTALRLALYSSRLRIAPLSDEDNCRFATYGKLNGKVRVAHGRLRRAAHTAENLQRVLDRLNTTTAPRVFVAGRAWFLRPQRLAVTDKYAARRMRTYRTIEWRPLCIALVATTLSAPRRLCRRLCRPLGRMISAASAGRGGSSDRR
jgi:hypothetical protein